MFRCHDQLAAFAFSRQRARRELRGCWSCELRYADCRSISPREDSMESIDMNALALVTGGEGGTFQRLGGAAGEQLGRWGANALPEQSRPLGQMVLPPAGRALGE